MSTRLLQTIGAERVFFAAVSGFMLAAATMKSYQLTYYGMPADSLVKSNGWYVLLIIAEFLFGIWLVSGLHRRMGRLVGMLAFFGFMEAALWQALTGHRSCGCLGRIGLNPWFAVAVDSAILVGLALFRPRGQEKTVSANFRAFCGFLLIALAFVVPGAMTMTAYRAAPTPPQGAVRMSYDLRHDPSFSRTRVAIELAEPTVQDLVALVAAQAHTKLSINLSAEEYFVACKPKWKLINHHTVRAFTALEAIANAMAVNSRWIKTDEGFELISDNPLARARPYWLAGLAFGALGSCSLAWSAKRGAVPPRLE